MTWTDFYLICFVFGFLLSLASLLGGASHLHVPHLHAHVHVDMGHGDAGAGVSPINFPTIAAFITWFGGTGYILMRLKLWEFLALGVAMASGLVGAAIVFFFLFKVLLRSEQWIDPADFDMVGVLGRVSSTIRPTGTGEIIFSQDGARRAAAARSEDGKAFPKNTEVVVTRYERGIAYVRSWEEMVESKSEENS